MMTFLLLISIAGMLTSTVYAILVTLGAKRLASRRRKEYPAPFTPPVSLLKPLHGSEPDLGAHLEGFFQQCYPEYEVIFCARSEQDEGLEVARKVAARFPAIRTKFLSSGTPHYANAKVWSLERMQSVAAYRFFVVSDSDVSVTPDYLGKVMAPFLDPQVGLVTCLYRGVAESSIWARLEAVGMSVEMSAGVLVADLLEGMKFALGPTMVVRRDSLEKIGGFRALGAYHADDFMLGNLISAKGAKVVLSTHAIAHHVLNTSFLASVLHQVRWMKSTRFSRPKGHLGTALTFSMPYGLFGAVVALTMQHPVVAAVLLAWSLGSRVLLAGLVNRMVVSEPNWVRSSLLYPVRDLLGFCYWLASYASNQVKWRGEVYNLLEDGFMHNDGRPAEHKPEAVLTA